MDNQNFSTIFQNEKFKILMNDKFKNPNEIIRILNICLIEELKKENSKLILILTFLEEVKLVYQSHLASICHTSIEDNDCIIYFGGYNFEDEVWDMIRHESGHLYHQRMSTVCQYFRRKRIMGEKLSTKYGYLLGFEKFFPIYSIRMQILNFFYIAIREGFAVYIEFDEENINFEMIYLELKDKLISLDFLSQNTSKEVFGFELYIHKKKWV